MISGKVNGVVQLKNKRGLYVKGILEAEDFTVEKLEPLDQIAEFLGLTSLKKITNGKIVTEFELSPKISEIKLFDFDSADLTIRSFYSINENEFLKGSVALSLPRTVLVQSRIFKKLLSIARERGDKLDFVVQISGFLGALRTELIESDLRDKLKERVNVNIQKYIQNALNKAIAE